MRFWDPENEVQDTENEVQHAARGDPQTAKRAPEALYGLEWVVWEPEYPWLGPGNTRPTAGREHWVVPRYSPPGTHPSCTTPGTPLPLPGGVPAHGRGHRPQRLADSVKMAISGHPIYRQYN